MSAVHIRLEIKLVLQGPVLTKSSSPGDFGLDQVFLRDADQNLVLPYSLVKGRLLEAWTELAAIDATFQPKTKTWLGEKPDEASGSFEPDRGRFHFTDFKCASANKARRTRIRMDEETEAADEGALIVTESPFTSGEEAAFIGELNFIADSAVQGASVILQLRQGLGWVTHFGSHQSVGFGNLLRVEVKELQPEPRAAVVDLGSATTFVLAIRPQSPFCLARPLRKQNVFESDDVISGAAIMGCLAQLLTDLGCLRGSAQQPAFSELVTHLNKIRFTHAFPTEDKADALRPVRAPLSLVKVKAKLAGDADALERLYDIADQPHACLIHDKAPEFAVDWKERKYDVLPNDPPDTSRERHSLDATLGWENPARELRVRTAIDWEKRRAQDEQLFAYECILPAGCQWLARVDLSRITDAAARAKVASQLQTIFGEFGLWGLGKTKALAKVAVLKDVKNALESKPHFSSPHRWIITLQTPALLADPEALLADPDALRGKKARRDLLHEAYQQVWSELATGELATGALSLKHFYAKQILLGGKTLWQRFQKNNPYNPWLLTDSGSVFILEAAEGKADVAAKLIEDWQHHGLPLPKWSEKLGADWQSNPFLPQNGYGEIVVNLDCHQDWQPAESALIKFSQI